MKSTRPILDCLWIFPHNLRFAHPSPFKYIRPLLFLYILYIYLVDFICNYYYITNMKKARERATALWAFRFLIKPTFKGRYRASKTAWLDSLPFTYLGRHFFFFLKGSKVGIIWILIKRAANITDVNIYIYLNLGSI